ncbi:hypothetical protein KIW84_063309 [Lathyrus oleraceus]|uniref:DUF7745 domain-containing protein n=1 Tax=Pisum sativum TaxID=3888 RepID=A0A9D4W9C4_PEA|nr:hypothetical protein KIW84_063309 [Pisum sativum]
MDCGRRNTKKYSFRCPDLKELRKLASFVLDPLDFKQRHGKLLSVLSDDVVEGLLSVLVQFYDPLYRCFTFPDYQIVPTLKEEAAQKEEKGKEAEQEEEGWRREELEGVNRLTLSSFARKRVLSCVNRLTQGVISVHSMALGVVANSHGEELVIIEMAGRGRDDAVIVEALGMLAGVLGGNPNVVGMGAARQLSEFQKNNPPMFKGAYDPDGA